jgi:hypothetical protein
MKKNSLNQWTIAFVLLNAFHFGCDDSTEENKGDVQCEQLECQVQISDIEHEEVTQRLEIQTKQMLTELQDRLEVINQDARLFELLNLVIEREEEDCREEWNEETQTSESFCETIIEGRMDPLEIDVTENSDEIVQDLLSQFSTDHLLRGEDGLIYKLDLRDMCLEELDTDESEDESEGAGEVDEDCIQQLENLQFKARVRAAGDGLQVELLATSQAQNLALITMVGNQLSLKLNLSTILSIMDDLIDDLSFNSVNGVVAVTLDLTDKSQLAFGVDIDDDIQVQGKIVDEIELDLLVPASRNMLSLVINKVSESIRLAGQAPALEERVRTRLVWAGDESEESLAENSEGHVDEYPEEELQEDGPLRDLSLLFGGGEFDLKISLTDLAKTVVGFSLEESGVQVLADDKELINVQLNPENGERVKVEFDHSEIEQDIFRINMLSALNEVKAKLDFSVLSEFDAPSELSDEYTLSFNGTEDALPAIQISEKGFEILEGTLSIDVAQAGVSFVAEAGQCIEGKDDEGEEEDESTEVAHVFENLTAVSCGG